MTVSPIETIDIAQAALLLQCGEVIAYPTEAVWGLGCDPYQAQAFAHILRLKQRPLEKGVILLADEVDKVAALLKPLSAARQKIVLESWLRPIATQAATTWLLPLSDEIPSWIYGQHQRVAVRVSQHPTCRALCQAFDGMIVSTSANPAGSVAATTAQQVYDYFADSVAIVAGEVGNHYTPSRIIDAVTGQIIRA